MLQSPLIKGMTVRVILTACCLLPAASLVSGCPSESNNPTVSSSPGAYGSVGAYGATTTSTAPVAATIKNPRIMKDGKLGKPGGALRLAQIADPKTFNYMLAKEVSSTGVLGFLFEGLTEQNAITSKIEPALAEKWEISKDGKSYTFTLRQGLQWSDGQPLTADDVVFTFNDLVANTKIPSDWADGLRIDNKLPKVEKVDALRVRFTTIKPFAPFLRSVGVTPILPKHVLAETLAADSQGNPKFNQFWGLDTDVQKIVGNGPFTIDSFSAGQRIVLIKNPYYWRVDAKGTRLPYLDRVVLMLVKDSDTVMLRFKANETDILDPVQPKDYQLLKMGEPSGGYKVIRGGPDFGTLFLMFNMKQTKNKEGKYFVDPVKQKWFNTTKFRQAVSFAIDRPSIIRNFFRNLAKPQLSAESEQSPFFNPHVPKYEYDPKKAEQLLKEAGFKKAGNVLQDSAGHPVEFVLLTRADDPVRVALTSQIKTDLDKLGMKVTFQPMDFNALVKRIDETSDWDAIVIGLTGGVEPHNGANVWLSNGNMHMFRMKEPGATPWEKEIDQLFAQGAVTMDEKKRKAIYDRYQEIASEQVPFIYTVNQEAMAAVRSNVGNFRYSALAPMLSLASLWNVSEVYVQQ